jgi:hypothetical protein
MESISSRATYENFTAENSQHNLISRNNFLDFLEFMKKKAKVPDLKACRPFQTYSII